MALRSLKAATPVILALALAVPSTLCAAPAPATEDPRDVRIRELTQRVADLEQALQGVNAQLESTTRSSDLTRSDIKSLRDRVDVLEGARRESASATDVARPAASPAVSPGAAPGAPSSPTATPSASAPAAATPTTAQPGAAPATAEDGLTRGRKQLQGGDPAGAEATLTAWLGASPNNPKAGEGAYLRGRARAQQSAWAEAASDYITALKGWPSAWWAPDAVVELARALGRLGKTAESCQALSELPARYPAASEGARKRAAAVAAQSRCGA